MSHARGDREGVSSTDSKGQNMPSSDELRRMDQDAEFYPVLRRQIIEALATIGEHATGREINFGGMKLRVLEHIALQCEIINAADQGKISPSDAIRQIVWAGQQGFYLSDIIDKVGSSYTQLKIKAHYSQYFDEQKFFERNPHPTMEQQVDEFIWRLPVAFAHYQYQEAMPISKFADVDASKELAKVFMLGKSVIDNVITTLRDVVALVKQECPDERIGNFLDESLRKMAECDDIETMKTYLRGFEMIYFDVCQRFPNVAEGRSQIERALACFERVHEVNLKNEKDSLNAVVFMLIRSVAMDLTGTGFLTTLHDVAKDAKDISDSTEVANTSVSGAGLLKGTTLQDKNPLRRSKSQDENQFEKMLALLKSISNKELTAVEIGAVAALTLFAPHVAPVAVPIVKAGSSGIKNFLAAHREIAKNTAIVKQIEIYRELGLRLHGIMRKSPQLKSAEKTNVAIETGVVIHENHMGGTSGIIQGLANGQTPVKGFADHAQTPQVQGQVQGPAQEQVQTQQNQSAPKADVSQPQAASSSSLPKPNQR